jgi:hypothetical protein
MNIRFDRQKIIFVAMVVVLGLLGFGLFLLCQPLLKAIDQDRAQEKTYVQETVFVKDLLATRRTSGIVAQLIAQDKISLLMDTISKLAEKNAVGFKWLQPPQVGPDKGELFKRVLVDAQVSAALKDLGVFLTSVRDMPEGLIDLENVRVWPDEVNVNVTMAKITFVLLVAKDNGQK